MFYLVLITIGAGAGFLAGLFGIGGGVLLVPAFLFFFHSLGIEEDVSFKLSVATSLSVISISTLFTSGFHIIKGKVDAKFVLKLIPVIVLGVSLGVLTSHLTPGKVLKKFFGIFLLLFSVKLLKDQGISKKTVLNEKLLAYLVSFLSAFLSALLGIGGGVVVNTLMFSFSEMEIPKVVGLASVLSFTNAFLGTILYFTMPSKSVLPHQFGYIYLPATVFVSAGSLVGTRIGIKLLHSVEHQTLKKAFGLLLVLLGVKMLLF